MIKTELIKNKILQNKIEVLLHSTLTRGENWKYFVNLIKDIVDIRTLNFAQDVLLNKILDKIKNLQELTDTELRNLLFVLLRSNFNVFENIKVGVKYDNE